MNNQIILLSLAGVFTPALYWQLFQQYRNYKRFLLLVRMGVK